MQFFQEFLHRQYRYPFETICSLSHINTEHLVDFNQNVQTVQGKEMAQAGQKKVLLSAPKPICPKKIRKAI